MPSRFLVAILVGILLAGCMAPPMKTGSIAVTSTPSGAKVLLDGKDTGKKTPCLLMDVTPGSHDVACELPDYPLVYQKITVTAGHTESPRFALKRYQELGALKIESTPAGLPILIDGSATGRKTPAIIEALEPGVHSVELKTPSGPSWKRKFLIGATKTTRISASLGMPAKYSNCILCAGDGGGEVYAINPADGATRKLADIDALLFALSPTGEIVATTTGDSKLTFLDYNGEIARQVDLLPMLAEGDDMIGKVEITSLDWRPGAEEILLSLSLDDGAQQAMAVYDCAEAKLKPLGEAATKGADRGGCYSPKGAHIAFLRGNEIFIANPDLSAPRRVLDANAGSKMKPPLAWSPDGEHLLCRRADGVAYVLGLDGSVTAKIEGIESGACWLPGGKKILAATSDGDVRGLGIYDLATGSWENLAKGFVGRQITFGRLREPDKDPSEL